MDEKLYPLWFYAHIPEMDSAAVALGAFGELKQQERRLSSLFQDFSTMWTVSIRRGKNPKPISYMYHSGSSFVYLTGNKPYDSQKQDVYTVRILLSIRFIFSALLHIQLS